MAAATSGTATVTATLGPGLTATALALSGVTNIELNLAASTFTITYGTQRKSQTFDLSAITTVTFAPATGAFVAS